MDLRARCGALGRCRSAAVTILDSDISVSTEEDAGAMTRATTDHGTLLVWIAEVESHVLIEIWDSLTAATGSDGL